MKHTQGEWVINHLPNHPKHAQYSIHNGQFLIAQCEYDPIYDDHTGVPTPSEGEANAKLIASAPKLLDAIKYYFSVLKEANGKDWDDKPDHVLSKMLEAFKKATS